MPDRPRPEAGGFFSWGHVAAFLLFFSRLFLTSIFNRFFFDFGGVLEAKMGPKIDVWSPFWALFFAPLFLNDFLMHFDVFFNAQLLKNIGFT